MNAKEALKLSTESIEALYKSDIESVLKEIKDMASWGYTYLVKAGIPIDERMRVENLLDYLKKKGYRVELDNGVLWIFWDEA